MTIELSVPVTTMSMSEYSSCSNVGLITHSLETRPTRTLATGPPHGIGEIVRAAEAPSMPSTSASFSWSAEMMKQATCVSF